MIFPTAKTIIDRAAIQLMDDQNIRWTRSELLDWVNEAQKQVVMLAPSASSTTAVVELVAGTRQDLPEDGWMLLDVYRNIKGNFPQVAGRVVRETSRSMLDRFSPYWHSEPATDEVDSYIYDLQDQRAFWVYPPNTGKGKLELNYSQNPAELTKEDDVLGVRNLYSGALVDYALYRACSKDAEYAPGLQLAQGYLATFMAVVQGKSQSEMENAPEMMKVRDRRGVKA